MSDVVLVYPRTGFDIPKVSIDLPLSLLSAANLVRLEFSVSIIDQRVDVDWKHRLISELRQKPLCVGVSAMTGPQIGYALEISQIAKEHGASFVVWGGPHATLMPQQTLDSPFVDFVVRGEAEHSFLALVRAIASRTSFSDVKGLSYRVFGTYQENPDSELFSLDDLPELPYHLVNVGNYVGNQGRFLDKNTRSLIFVSSRGCPHQCAYCCNPAIYKGHWRGMSERKVFEHTESLVEQYTLDAIAFHDEDFLIDRKRAESFACHVCGEFEWWCQSRMDCISKSNLDLLYEGGLRGVQPGIESGSPRILRFIRKGETVNTMLETNRKLSHTKIRPLYNFMMGFPTETYEDLMESVDLAYRLLEENSNAEMTGFYNYVPYPGTLLFDLAIGCNFKPPKTLGEWALYNRQQLLTPWAKEHAARYSTIMTMSKFLDGKRMLRRLKDNGELNTLTSLLVRGLIKLYRHRWQHRDFERTFENKIAELIRNRLFHWQN
jgi:anaerobic magnesium-protoporphyrin IX monomethyl ester cyclase